MAATVQPQAAPFDALAESYDRIFTDSLIGRAQRNAVWRQLDTTFLPGQRVLELNCGTGVDALHLAARGVRVEAFDVSPAMIRVAGRRLLQGNGLPVRFRVLATEQLSTVDSVYDGAFSNFGGLNCVEDLRQVARNLARLVRPLGQILLCLATRFCVWETAWWLAHGKPAKAFRRLRRSGVTAELSPGSSVHVQYPSINELRRLFAPEFSLVSMHGIGLFVPPSYVEPQAKRFPKLLCLAARLDARLSSLPGVRVIADHVLLKFRRVSH
ncbi:MAG TPA: class I SAM-dependent methyltransferase [Terriglobales bacterium]|nr:class I SAM-dependent methyltransferase [Terriglobales bacterium]